ncbi:unnamed protein product [Auanema sp. JU1783]|nr:unnamed protein product [Auanema sp. JU1783]
MELHPRHGTLLKKKQEQWAKERADKEQSGEWYPFGSPGGGSPNRKHTTICYDSKSKEDTHHVPTASSNENTSQMADPTIDSSMRQMISPTPVDNVPSVKSQSENPSAQFRPYLVPNSYNPNVHAWTNQMQYAYNLLPPGMIPIPISVPLQPPVSDGNKDSYYAPIIPGYTGNFYYPPALYNNTSNQFKMNPTDQDNNNSQSGPANSQPSRASSSNQSLSPTFDSRSKDPSPRDQEEQNQNHQKENDENRIDCEENFFIDRKLREENENRRHQEEIEALKKRRESQLAEALEKAKHEAEVLKKAKLFKHVLEGNNRSPELEERILGVDSTTGNRILNEINQWERHKKREHQELDKIRSSRKSQSAGGKPTSARSQSSPAKSRSKSMEIDSGNEYCQPHHFNPSQDFHKQSRNEPASRNQNSHIPLSRNCQNRLSLRAPKSMSVTKDEIRKNPSMMNMLSSSQQAKNSTFASPRNQSESRIPVPQSRKPAHLITQDHNVISPSTNHIEYQPTPSSARRTSKRFEDKNLYNDQKNPLLNPIATRKMRPTMKTLSNLSGTAGSLDSNEDSSSGSEHVSPNGSPVPSIVIDTSPSKKSVENDIQSTPQTQPQTPKSYRNVLQSPNYGTPANGGLRAAIYKQKITQKGCSTHDEDTLSPDVRRKAEASLSRTSSMNSLKGSISNLRGSMLNLNMNIEESPAFNRFKSMNPAYRSFNNKKCSERQKQTLERLAQLRKEFRSTENFVGRNTLAIPTTPVKP